LHIIARRNMVRSMIGLILLFATELGMASAAANPAVLTAEAYKHPSIHELNWLGRQIAGAMASGPFKLDEKTTFLYNYPTRAIVIRATACEAWAVGAALCAPEGSAPEETLVVHHEEIDAVRHFSLAAHLTCAQGRQVTEIFLAANEGNPAKWGKSSHMDIHNNYAGIFWAGEKGSGNCRPFGFTQRVAEAALEKLRSGELVTLKQGKSRCAPGGFIDENPLARLREFRSALRELDARCGGKTVTSP
jgi:hypothetical protein